MVLDGVAVNVARRPTNTNLAPITSLLTMLTSRATAHVYVCACVE